MSGALSDLPVVTRSVVTRKRLEHAMQDLLTKPKVTKDECRPAVVAIIREKLNFDPSNVAFAPIFEQQVQTAYESCCGAECDDCKLLYHSTSEPVG
jgi:hypothetical protein